MSNILLDFGLLTVYAISVFNNLSGCLFLLDHYTRQSFPATYQTQLNKKGLHLPLFEWTSGSTTEPVRISDEECSQTWNLICSVYIPAKIRAATLGEICEGDENYDPEDDTVWININDIDKFSKETGFFNPYKKERRSPSDVVHNSRKPRSDAMTPIIKWAQTQTPTPFVTSAVWALIVSMAQSPTRKPPVLEYVKSSGVRYTVLIGLTGTAILSEKNLRDRLERELKRLAKTR